MPIEKIQSLDEAISCITDGSSVALGLALEHAIPFAAGHEIVRQRIKDLTLIGPISDVLFDQLIGTGVVSAVRAAWVGNVSAGIGNCFRSAVESGDFAVENHSNFSIALALKAAAMGVPYLPTKSLLGSSILEESDLFEMSTDPFDGEPVVLVPAIEPDWAIVHVQRADRYGNCHFWGNTGITEEAIGAADHVLVTAEEIVSPDVVKSDPSRTNVVGEDVTAVVECPFGAHPSPVAGYYNRHNDYFLDYKRATETSEAFAEWAAEWIHGVSDRDEYANKVDADLDIHHPTVAAEVRYGQ